MRMVWTILGPALIIAGIIVMGLAIDYDAPKSAARAVVAAVTPACEDEHTVYLAVLGKIFGRLPLYNKYSRDVTEESLLAAEQKIADMRAWAAGLTDDCVRNQYVSWLDYYQGGVNEAREQLRHPAVGLGKSKYDEERRIEKAKVAAYEVAHPIPEFPGKEAR